MSHRNPRVCEPGAGHSIRSSPTVGGPRACAAAEFDGVIELLDRVFREGSDQSAQTDYPLIFDPARRENMRVISVDGAVVAHVPVAPRGVVIDGDAFTLAIIGGTVTHPDHRHRGYATACLRDGVRIMRERGWPVSALWTIERTFPFYRNSGWEAVGSQGWMYTLAADDVARLRTSRHRIAVYEPGNHQQLSTIRDIHDREPLRIAGRLTTARCSSACPRCTPSCLSRPETWWTGVRGHGGHI